MTHYNGDPFKGHVRQRGTDPSNRDAVLKKIGAGQKVFDREIKAKKLTQGPGKKLYPGESLRFPSDVNTEATFMEFKAFQFQPKGAEKGASAFANVGTVKTHLDSMYLPSCKTSLNEAQEWSMDEASLLGRAAAAGLATEGGFSKKLFEGLKSGAAAAVGKAALNVGQTLAASEGAGMVEQQALKYTGPNQRSFSITYTLIPKSKQETKTVHKIIKAFRYHSAPHDSKELQKMAEGMIGNAELGIRTYKFPSLFKISWLTKDGNINPFTPQYDACYCDSVAVEYGDENFTTFHDSGGAPVSYTLTLSFKELEFPTKGRIKKGF